MIKMHPDKVHSFYHNATAAWSHARAIYGPTLDKAPAMVLGHKDNTAHAESAFIEAFKAMADVERVLDIASGLLTELYDDEDRCEAIWHRVRGGVSNARKMGTGR